MGRESIGEDWEELPCKVLNAKGPPSSRRRFMKWQKEKGDVVVRMNGDMNQE